MSCKRPAYAVARLGLWGAVLYSNTFIRLDLDLRRHISVSLRLTYPHFAYRFTDKDHKATHTDIALRAKHHTQVSKYA